MFTDLLILVCLFYHLRSEFPLIFSIENHCGLEQQDRMADHLTSILGDLLYTTQPDQEATDLPSPMDLKKKILIKAKRLPQDQGAEEEEDDDDDDERDESQKKAKKQVTLCKTCLIKIMRNNISEGVKETVRSCELHTCRSLPWIRQRSCQVSLAQSPYPTMLSSGTTTCLPLVSQRPRRSWTTERRAHSLLSTTASSSAGSTQAQRGRIRPT